MPASRLLHVLILCAVSVGCATSLQAEPFASKGEKTIVLVAGETAKVDVIGHHDYLAGCDCLKVLLEQTAGVKTIRINDGWPTDDTVFDKADSIVFYTDGGGKQAFLASAERIARMKSLVSAGVGIVLIHQAVDFPDEHITLGQQWIGGVYQKGTSGRGHWPSEHIDFPEHPISRGVTPWKINDGWLNGLTFVDDMKGITPLVWSGKEFVESKAGIDKDIVCWTYARPQGGRSFSFTGLDAHSAFELPGMTQLVVNGILWSAGIEIPEQGAPCKIEVDALHAMQTPREPKKPAAKPAKPAAKPATSADAEQAEKQ